MRPVREGEYGEDANKDNYSEQNLPCGIYEAKWSLFSFIVFEFLKNVL